MFTVKVWSVVGTGEMYLPGEEEYCLEGERNFSDRAQAEAFFKGILDCINGKGPAGIRVGNVILRGLAISRAEIYKFGNQSYVAKEEVDTG